MNIQVIGFDWDAGNRAKCQKHGVSQAEIEALFYHSDVSITEDLAHSQHEPRFFAFGTTDEDRAVLVVFTLREKEGMTCVTDPSVRGICIRRKGKHMKKKFPTFKNDEEIDTFLEQDISEYIHPGNLTKVTFEFLPKTERITLRVPPELLTRVKKKAKKQGMSYHKYIRQVMEESLST